ncbi:hypothetical protein C8R44DRAFT_873708 [Mycena epipterygia]|nr:hypothetical protein C8R44DRAFT_873708 [Mycena epipterygia]
MEGVFERLHTLIKEKTGWVGFTMLGGPMPNVGGQLMVNVYHCGESPAGHSFKDSHPAWNANVGSQFTEFLHRCFSRATRDTMALPEPEDPFDDLIGMSGSESDSPAPKKKFKAPKRPKKNAKQNLSTAQGAVPSRAPSSMPATPVQGPQPACETPAPQPSFPQDLPPVPQPLFSLPQNSPRLDSVRVAQPSFPQHSSRMEDATAVGRDENAGWEGSGWDDPMPGAGELGGGPLWSPGTGGLLQEIYGAAGGYGDFTAGFSMGMGADMGFGDQEQNGRLYLDQGLVENEVSGSGLCLDADNEGDPRSMEVTMASDFSLNIGARYTGPLLTLATGQYAPLRLGPPSQDMAAATPPVAESAPSGPEGDTTAHVPDPDPDDAAERAAIECDSAPSAPEGDATAHVPDLDRDDDAAERAATERDSAPSAPEGDAAAALEDDAAKAVTAPAATAPPAPEEQDAAEERDARQYLAVASAHSESGGLRDSDFECGAGIRDEACTGRRERERRGGCSPQRTGIPVVETNGEPAKTGPDVEAELVGAWGAWWACGRRGGKQRGRPRMQVAVGGDGVADDGGAEEGGEEEEQEVVHEGGQQEEVQQQGVPEGEQHEAEQQSEGVVQGSTTRRKRVPLAFLQTYGDNGEVIPLQPGSTLPGISSKRKREIRAFEKRRDAEEKKGEAAEKKLQASRRNFTGVHDLVVLPRQEGAPMPPVPETGRPGRARRAPRNANDNALLLEALAAAKQKDQKKKPGEAVKKRKAQEKQEASRKRRKV